MKYKPDSSLRSWKKRTWAATSYPLDEPIEVADIEEKIEVMHTVRPGNLIPLMVKSIQELSAKVDSLQAEIDSLKAAE